MKINLRKKENSNGKTSLFLEYYLGFTKDAKGKIKHNRKYEFLDIQIYSNPKNTEQRNHNKKLTDIAETVLKQRQVESLQDDFEINSDKKLKTNFVEYYQGFLDKRSFKSGTLRTYKYALNHLVSYCNPDTTTFKNIDENFILGFKKYLDDTKIFKTQSESLSNNTKNLYFNAFKSVVLQAYRGGIISKNPFLNVKGFSLEETERTYLTFDEVQKLKDTDCNKPVVKQAFLFSCFSGLRFSDIQLLEWNQIIKENGVYKINFKQKKTGGQEYLNLNNQAVIFLGKKGNPEERVFKGLRYDMTINNVINRWVLKAGINKDVTFHSGRHTFATMLLTNGVDIFTVSKLLGHKKIETTQVYAKIINLKQIEAVNKIPELK